MTDREINEAVARKLGWHRKNKDLWISPKQANGNDYLCSDIPPYCGHIEAAWEIIEKCEYFCLVKPLHNKQWKCDIGSNKEIVVVWADTAPMAICLAFLKLL